MIDADHTAWVLGLGKTTYPRIAEILRAREHSTAIPIIAGSLRAERNTARDAFCSRMGWTRGQPFSTAQLQEGRAWQDGMDKSRLTAHQNCPIDLPGYFYEQRVPVSIVSHTLCPIAQVQAYAELENLRVEVLPASWLAPGERIAVVFMRIDYKSIHERRKS